MNTQNWARSFFNALRVNDRKSTEKSYRIFRQMLLINSLRYTYDEHKAADAVDNVVLKILLEHKRGQLCHVLRPEGYTLTMLRNHFYNLTTHEQMKHRHHSAMTIQVATPAFEAEMELAENEFKRELKLLLGEKKAMAIRLFHMEGMNYEEVAASLKIQPKTARNMIGRANSTIKSSYRPRRRKRATSRQAQD